MSEERSMSSEYNEDGFWSKIKEYAVSCGKELILMVLKLYYAMQRPDIPIKAKSIIIGALAYFIMPIDAIPDTIPVVGFSDDFGVIAAALAAVAMHINDDVVRQADDQLGRWFG